MLTNPRAERVRSVRALGRRSVRERAGRFVAEGPQAVREALTYAPDSVIEVYRQPDQASRHEDIVGLLAAADVPVHDTDAHVLAAMADTEQPQGLLAVCRPVDLPVAQALAAAHTVIVLGQVRDPGNAGTVIRCADAAGADAVIVTAASVDLYNPKLVRATAGSLWHLPIARGVSIDSAITACQDHGLRVLAADGAGTTSLPDADLRGPHAWLTGNEAWGLPAEVRAACDDVVRVPIYGKAESLNLAMAATVCLYASAAARHGAA